MNSISPIGANNQNYQMSFKAKGNKKVASEFIDKINDAAVEFLNKDRPLEEKREIAIRKALQKLKIKCPFIGKKVKPKEATVEHIQTAADKIEADYKQYEQYIRKAVEDGSMDADHAITLLIKKNIAKFTEADKFVEAVNRAHRQAYLDKLKKRDPELYKYILRRDAEAEISQMSNWQIAKKIIQNLFKKS